MIIAQISDTHIALDTPDTDQRIRDFERAIADINALDPGPDVIVHTGDIVHNGRSDEYAEAVRILAEARAPVYVIPWQQGRPSKFMRGLLTAWLSGARFQLYSVRDRGLPGQTHRGRHPQYPQQ